MPPPHCHFTTKAPSSSTVEYTVSTAFPPQTLSSHLLLYISFSVRALLASLILLAVVEYSGFVDFGFYVYFDGAVGSKFWAGAAAVGFLVFRRFYNGESCRLFNQCCDFARYLLSGAQLLLGCDRRPLSFLY